MSYIYSRFVQFKEVIKGMTMTKIKNEGKQTINLSINNEDGTSLEIKTYFN